MGVQGPGAPRRVQEPRARPDPRPLRIAFGVAAVATASAILTALSVPIGGAAGPLTQTTVTLPAEASPVVRHIIQYIKLKPGQTAPPNTVVKQAPALPPQVIVVTTRQSGAKP